MTDDVSREDADRAKIGAWLVGGTAGLAFVLQILTDGGARVLVAVLATVAILVGAWLRSRSIGMPTVKQWIFGVVSLAANAGFALSLGNALVALIVTTALCLFSAAGNLIGWDEEGDIRPRMFMRRRA
ncbi:hypothetical protein EV193_105451 [Herbihabitans rhizosphaerae]|uniref:Uncharacterized protein n=1 Tax=Herbihabitans rhizosphaerae TaxID=1872711 RepID=A0A4Q7KQB7_9PSEU|nr:hypothetical protein [Herbihabitans rhizosphaerae]RZS37891.1 hypothetical protein EV193_105451 [Herbihabitans rhizosphaerae]